ncbi:hypothetical protein LTR08_009306 [Meristemomyces frigidus]|nr:hypothetical protein LTR08_009306 [Meristemomyces frigidus]
MPAYRDDQILIISPGSETTLAQLGLPESFTPARHRIRSRMFRGEKDGEYEPVKIRRKEQSAPAPTAPVAGVATDAQPKPGPNGEAEWEEDRVSEDGAIWPIREGRIVDWQCFYALMTHVYNTVNPPFHTPILLIAEPVWTTKEHERVTQFFFEKFKVPGFTMVDSAMAASYAYGVTTATVVDVGLDKADITCIADSTLHDVGRGLAVADCGGEAMTSRLAELLTGRKGFTRQVCEQLKKSSICEILPPDVDMPTGDSAVADGTINPAAAASTGISGRKPSAANELLPRGPGLGTQVGEEKKLENDEGVLDIASIVTKGNMSEYLAQKDQEKAERLAAKQHKKGSDAQSLAANKPVRQPNHKRTRNTFVYEDFALHDAMKKAGMSSQSMVDMQSAMDEGPNKRQKTPEPQSAVSDRPADSNFTAAAQDTTSIDPTHPSSLRREIEVGPERFLAASGSHEGEPGLLDRLADAVHRTIQSCPDTTKRPDLWDALILVGNGARVRGFKDALLETLQRKYTLSPSSATLFTSELPSSMTTPMATGANTPLPPLSHQYAPPSHPGPSGANSLAQNPQLQHLQQHLQPQPQFPPPSAAAAMGLAPQPSHHPHHPAIHAPPQTPTSIRLAKIPEYFPEWKEVGYDEAVFLGAQVAAKVLFVVDAGASKGYLSRTEYNELGPGGMGEVFL